MRTDLLRDGAAPLDGGEDDGVHAVDLTAEFVDVVGQGVDVGAQIQGVEVEGERRGTARPTGRDVVVLLIILVTHGF